ncbi:MAG: hypothetical protein WC208_15000 [Gallionella sp.]|jgi:hypothetical protein
MQTIHRLLEPETLVYNALTSKGYDQFTVNEMIKAVKYGSGVTLTSQTLNLSTVAGSVFGSNPLTDLRWTKGFKITLTDTLGQTLVFWGGGNSTETLSSEMITGWTTPGIPTCEYETLTVNANGHDLDSVINTTATSGFGNAYSNLLGSSAGQLNKIVIAYTKTSGQDPIFYTKDTGFGAAVTVNQTLTGSHTLYYTTTTGDKYAYIENSALASWNATITHKQVTAPSATGIYGLSTKGGSNGYVSIGATFNPNDTSYTIAVTVS